MAEAIRTNRMHDAQLQAFNEGQLRSVQCPSDIADQIGGWTSEGVGQGYGSGYPLNVLNEWLEKALVGLD